MTNSINVAVVGMGAIGGIISGCLAKAGIRVSAVEVVDNHRNKIAKDGIKISGVKSFTVNLTSAYAKLNELQGKNFNFIVIALKAIILERIADEFASLDLGDTPFVGFLNGIDSEDPLLKAVGRDRVLRVAVNFGGSLVEDGHANWTFNNPPTYIGGYNQTAQNHAETIAKVFSEADLEIKATNDIKYHVWKKAIINAMLSTSVLTGQKIGQQLELKETNSLFHNILKERIAVAKNAGINMEPEFFDWCVEFHKKAKDHIPSAALDIAAGRTTEVDYIDGKFIEYGHKHSVPVPMDETLYALVKGKESISCK